MSSVSPAVTVVVVSYNHARFIQAALDSIKGQTLAASRVIVVDDASSDDTVEVARRWIEANGGPFELIAHPHNTGLCRGLNEALSLIDTPLYTYMSADDLMVPHRLESQVERWVEDGSSAVGVYSNARRIDADGVELLPDYRTLHEWPPSADLEGDIHTQLLRQCWLPAASVLVMTAAVREVGGYDERWFFEDYDLWLRLAAVGRFLVVDEPLVEFRELDSSLGHVRFSDTDLGFLEARVGIFAKQVGVSPAGDAYIRRAMTPLAIRLWKLGGDPGLVLDALEKAQRIEPSRQIALRVALLRRGVQRQPAALTAAERAASTARGVAGRVSELIRSR